MDVEEAREGHSLKSRKLGLPLDAADDEKYVSGLSAILVASIQEAKDRISQIEFIFCSQLYPNFQSKSETLHRFYSDAAKSLENQRKEKEKEMLLQIEELRLENERILKERAPLELDLIAKQHRIEELEREIRKKGEEVDEGMELQKNLVELVQSKGSLVMERERQLKESDQKRKGVLARVNKLEEVVEDLRDELRRKNERMAEEMELREKLSCEIETSEKERKSLLGQIDDLHGEIAGMRRKLRMRTQEVEEGEGRHKRLSQEMELKSIELLESKKKLDVYEKENKLLLDKVKCLEERIDELCKVRSGIGESSNGMDSIPKLLKQVESVTSELQAEKTKRSNLTEAYKRLKSQHNYLRGKVGLTAENMLHQNKSENESDLSKHNSLITAPGLTFENPNTSNMGASKTANVKSDIPEDNFGGLENTTPDVLVAVCDTSKLEVEALDDDKGVNLSPPSSSFHRVSKCPSSTKSVSVSGTKRPASSWRQTRSHQSRVGSDSHDDFLDTPLENIRENLNKDLNKEDHPGPIQIDPSMDCSDDETQDFNAKSSPQRKPASIPVVNNKRSFKYIEPVRKKAERDNLKGVECKQCKKFYEAVLPNADGKDPDNSKHNLRCEHHEGVSRHRYRYVPPMTPEGFWNIGFESEI